MYAGHVAIGLALQARYPKTNPVATIFGIAFLDFLDGALVAARVEHISPAPRLPLGFTLDFIDWDHSLLMAVIWSVLWGLLFRKDFAVAFAAALSHWFADFLVHDQDLALWPFSPIRLGTGLWPNYPIGSWFFEGAFAAALTFYWWRTAQRRPRVVLIVMAFIHASFSPWTAAPKWVAANLPAQTAITVEGLLVIVGFVVPCTILTRALRRAPS